MIRPAANIWDIMVHEDCPIRVDATKKSLCCDIFAHAIHTFVITIMNALWSPSFLFSLHKRFVVSMKILLKIERSLKSICAEFS